MKRTIEEKAFGFICAVALIAVLLVFALPAIAQDIDQTQIQAQAAGNIKPNRNRSGNGTPTPAVRATNKQQQQQQQGQILDSDIDLDLAASASASGGSNGDQISMNTSQFYALSLMFPQAVDCFTGAQGGGQIADADEGTSGFLGIHWLNRSCWLQKQASAEQDIELNARLRCGDKHYRNAIAYDVPKKERQRTCIQMKVDSARDQMDQFAADMAAIEASSKQRLEELQSCHARVDAANERTERCFESIVGGK